MPITLQEAKVGMADHIDQQVIDEFRRSSLLLDQLTFDNAVSPGTGGSTLTYGYTRLKTPSTAGFRAINNEYSANEAVRENQFVNLKIFGGAFEVDRVIQDTSGQINEMEFQLNQKIRGAANLFHNTVINGDSAVDANAFDGLDKALTGSTTELNTDSHIDLSTASGLDSNKFTFLEEIDNFLAELDGRPSMLMGNSKLITKIKAIARRAGYLTSNEDAFGRTVTGYDNIPLVDLGYFYDGTSTNPVVPIVERDPDGDTTPTSGLTDLYAVSLGMDGFHGVSPTGNGVIRTFLPDFNAPGAVKKGEVEMVGAIALKATRKAGVLRNIKVQ
ncbi:major capsid protein [Gracilibacillus thailandensis]|uniref:Phage capsid protein n=1 Tax=Gracilibacillus thailandensis TaxID=563735 RepID=A0A6N7QSR0_9BACI|nr:phage capsid protein [Gracilibacillus thailandensis]MRI65157.1 phage capsid protein [Gracilibacillus thailandensis]